MPIGYEGYAKLNGKSGLCTGASVPRTRVRLDSAAGYGADWVEGIQTPRNYDWDTFDGSLTFEVTQEILSEVITWMDYTNGRNTSRPIEIHSRFDSEQSFPECYWNSISLSASEGSLAECNIGFVAIDGPKEYVAKDDFINNRTGVTSAADFKLLNPLNSNVNSDPVPFWKTSISNAWSTAGTGKVEPISWTLTLNQDVQKIFTCGYSSITKAPDYIGIGQITGELQVEMLILNDTITISDDINGSVTIGSTTINLGNMKLESHTDDVQSDMVPVSLVYSIFG